MNNPFKTIKKILGSPLASVAGFCLLLACSTVRENGEPSIAPAAGTAITTDEQRQAIYNRGGTYTPQNANPIPPSNRLGLNEKSSDINRKRNIEEGINNTNEPANTPTQERPRQLPNNTPPDTINPRVR